MFTDTEATRGHWLGLLRASVVAFRSIRWHPEAPPGRQVLERRLFSQRGPDFR